MSFFNFGKIRTACKAKLVVETPIEFGNLSISQLQPGPRYSQYITVFALAVTVTFTVKITTDIFQTAKRIKDGSSEVCALKS
jgi:hypothetical protein